jgi:uncharacterized caspase-like protein
MKYALIIGNNRYTDHKLAQLKTPAADSQALANVLGDRSIGEFDEVTPLINQTEGRVSRAISAFLASKKPDDLVLIYFSGHGVLDDRGRLFLALKDTQTSLLKSTAISSSFIADEMDSCRSKRQILILDCCHSGAFGRGIKGGEQKAVTETTFEGSGFGRVVLTASDSTQFALEGDQVIKQTELSLFTHFLLEGLQTGKADTNNDGHVSLDEWYDYTYAQVLSTTPKQVPHRWSYHQQGDLVIAKNPFVKKKVAELPTELLRLLESPYSSVREVAIKELAILLNSRDADLAKLAKATLEKLKEDDSRSVSMAATKILSEVDKPVVEVSRDEQVKQIESRKPAEAEQPPVERKIIQQKKPIPAKALALPILKPATIIAFVVFAGMVFVALIASPWLVNLFSGTPEPTAFSTPTEVINTATVTASLATEVSLPSKTTIPPTKILSVYGSEDFSYENSGATYCPKAQSFAFHEGVQIYSVALHMEQAYNGNWKVRIISSLPRGGGERGLLDKADLASKTLGSAEVPNSEAGWVNFYFPIPISLEPSETYFLLIDSYDLGDLGPNSVWSSSSPGSQPGPFSDGTGWIYVYDWSDNENTQPQFEQHIDYAFRIYYSTP